jgi:hypothetical protein
VEKGLIDAEDASLRERMVALRFRRDELSQEISDLTRRFEAAEPSVTPRRVEELAFALRRHLNHGSPELRQAYARLVLRGVCVTPEEIRISGSKAVLAKTAAKGAENSTPAVLPFVREWRARLESDGHSNQWEIRLGRAIAQFAES